MRLSGPEILKKQILQTRVFFSEVAPKARGLFERSKAREPTDDPTFAAADRGAFLLRGKHFDSLRKERSVSGSVVLSGLFSSSWAAASQFPQYSQNKLPL